VQSAHLTRIDASVTLLIRSHRLTWDDCQTVSSVLGRAFENVLIYQPALLRNMVTAGNFVALAEYKGEAVGALVGHIGLDDRMFLYSGPMAVLQEHRRHGVGAAMKRHQREWALRRGIDRIVWPFHPRNVSSAYVSLSLPGVRCDRFETDYYGPAPAGSRLLASWHLHEGDRSVSPIVEWVEIVGRSDAELVADLSAAFAAGRSVVSIVEGRYGLA
jgi:predicted GNAT superfamily acetyltransferase